MALCHQATSYYLSQCWPRSVLPYGITRPQWVHTKGSTETYHCPVSFPYQDPPKVFINLPKLFQKGSIYLNLITACLEFHNFEFFKTDYILGCLWQMCFFFKFNLSKKMSVFKSKFSIWCDYLLSCMSMSPLVKTRAWQQGSNRAVFVQGSIWVWAQPIRYVTLWRWAHTQIDPSCINVMQYLDQDRFRYLLDVWWHESQNTVHRMGTLRRPRKVSQCIHKISKCREILEN